MAEGLDDLGARDGERVPAAHMATALTAGRLRFDDGSTQTFSADGTTSYVDAGATTRGEWTVEGDGRFGSFWPPSYRASYDLRWIVEDGRVVGLRFIEQGRGSRFDGRY
ncbi:hypothetical protein AB0F91_06485 [Amycolatopsis sp. NPDC023774]|uniref:hypothetical protein n=1 Tax=Amycolatopsis sp. NPDC023774 TaxID=3155015 RepID=UPI0033D2D860